LFERNEYLIGSHHPLRETLIQQTGLSTSDRNAYLNDFYEKAKTYVLTNPTFTTASTASTNINLATGNVLEVLLIFSTTLTFSNPRIGTYIIKIKQDNNGGNTVVFPTMKWADNAVPTITSSPNRTDLITIIYDGVDYYATCLQNF
jgi:hypothetical protein